MSSPPTSNGTTTSAPTSATSFMFFFIITAIYTVIKTKVKKEHKTIWLLVYLFLVIIVEFFLNLSLTNYMCGSNNFGLALSVTAIPWILIFGIINIMLIMFPGWLSPFSNTFGYLAAKLSGVNSLVEDLLKEPKNANNNIKETLDYLYTDKALFVNELTETNIDDMWGKMTAGGLFKENISNEKEKKDELISIVRLKTSIAEFIWYILSGALVTSISYNYIINATCEQSVGDMQRRHKDYEQLMKKEFAQKQDSGTNPKVYATYD